MRTRELQLYPARSGLGATTIRNLCVQGDSCFVRPASGHITNGVAASSQHQHRQVKALHKFHTLGMPFGGRRRCWVREYPAGPCPPRPMLPGLTFDGQIEAT